MINESNVQSGLVTGRMYDRAMKLIEDAGYNVQTDSIAWGNYRDAPVTGITEYSTDYGATWTAITSTTKGTTTRWLLKTGHTDYTKAKNIYDLAGNLWEWTNEESNAFRVARGCFYGDWTTGSPAAYRGRYHAVNDLFYYIGFRVRTLPQVASLWKAKVDLRMESKC